MFNLIKNKIYDKLIYITLKRGIAVWIGRKLRNQLLRV